MQKETNFFEQNVQWIALGLGGVFLLLMVYFYVLSQPVSVDVGGKKLGPGEVEPATLAGPVADVDRDIRDSTIPEIVIKDYVSSFVATIQGTKDQAVQLAGNQIHSFRDGGLIEQQGPNGGPMKDEVIVKLPAPPAPKAGLVSVGRSQIAQLDPNFFPDPTKPNLVQKVLERDIDWASASFVISGRELLKAFTAAFDAKKIEEAGREVAPLMQTQVIDVQLIRQEILPGNKGGKEVVIQPLKNNLDRPPFPGKTAPEVEVVQYLNWATQNPDEVKTPLFYEVIGGEPWMPPDEETQRLQAGELKAKREEAKRRIEENRRSRTEKLRQPRNPGLDSGMMEGEEGMIGAQPMRPAPGVRQPAAARPLRAGQQARQAAVVEAGKFDVFAEEDIHIIAHDETIEAGKTYRYKIRYRLFNPIYKSVRMAKKELSDQFAIVSVDSDWTKPVTMRPKVEFFLAKINGDRSTFDVFQMKEGQMKKSQVTVGPGDAIGGSGWSLIDVRGSGLKAYGLLMDANGQTVRREPEGANPSDRYFNLLQEVEGLAVVK